MRRNDPPEEGEYHAAFMEISSWVHSVLMPLSIPARGILWEWIAVSPLEGSGFVISRSPFFAKGVPDRNVSLPPAEKTPEPEGARGEEEDPDGDQRCVAQRYAAGPADVHAAASAPASAATV